MALRGLRGFGNGVTKEWVELAIVSSSAILPRL